MLGRKEEQLPSLIEESLILLPGSGWGEGPGASELHYLKQQAAKLYRLNGLHRRLAGTLHLTGLVEEFSLWLQRYLPHLAFGYCRTDGKCRHLSCRAYGKERRQVMAIVRRVCGQQDDAPCQSYGGYLYYQWEVETEDGAGRLFLICRRKLAADNIELVNDALEVLVENLHRGLEYEKIHFQATTDNLTGLANRRIFDERSRELMTAARSYSYPLALLVLDLDNFKQVNDTLGHLYGDRVLVEVADIMRSSVRATDLVARIGGDEFVMLLDNTDLSGAKILAERLCRAVDDIELPDSFGLGVSIGLSAYNGREDLSAWMKRTDALLYQAKGDGKARVVLADVTGKKG